MSSTNPAPRYLTKTRFKLALECPTKLFYTGKPQYLDTSLEDSFLAALAEGGYQVGELARLMYPGTMIEETDHAGALAHTQALLAADEVTIHEAALVAGNCFVRVDILRKHGRVIELLEVKAKSYDPRTDGDLRTARGQPMRGYLPHLHDIAYQQHVASLALPGHEFRSFLVLADKSRAASVDGLNQRFKVRREGDRVVVDTVPGTDASVLGEPLLAAVPVDGLIGEIVAGSIDVNGQQLPFPEAVQFLADAYRADRRIDPHPGARCANCSFKVEAPDDGHPRSGFHECWSAALGFGDADFAGGTVLDLWNSSQKQALMDRGVYRLAQLRPADLGLPDPVPPPGKEGVDRRRRQWYQVSRSWPGGGPFFLDRSGLAETMGGWRWPLHFIDFETCAVAIPFTHGQRPYETVAFQFSHHVMHEGGRVEHHSQFLEATPGVDPTLPFLRALRAALEGDDGTAFRWAAHENTVLNQLRRRLMTSVGQPSDAADLIAFIETLTTRSDDGHAGRRTMVDLAQVAAARFFHPDTGGSSSLKKLLPAVMRSSPRLRELYGELRYGTQAMPSLNLREGIAWWVERDGQVCDPYQLLPPVFEDLSADEMAAVASGVADDLAEGGAAMAAYARLQFENISEREREVIERALLRYCELDTLAMVMVVQAWQGWLQ